MRCRYCAGEEPDMTEEVESSSRFEGISIETFRFEYPEIFERAYERAYWPSFTNYGLGREVICFIATQAARFTHNKSGFVVEVHTCFEQDKTLFKAAGVSPQTTREIKVFTDFFNLVIREEETRGRKPLVQLEDLLDALRRLPDAARWPEIAGDITRTLQAKYGPGFDVSEDTLKKMLRRHGISGLRAAREEAKKREEDK